MKKIFFTVFFVIVLAGVQNIEPLEVFAQEAQAKTIFDYKDDLKLQEKQIVDLKKTISDLQNYVSEKRAQLDTLGKELLVLIKDKSELKLIKQKLEQISKVQVDISYTDIESSRKVETILKPDQIEKWKKIQEDYRVKAQAEAAKIQEKE